MNKIIITLIIAISLISCTTGEMWDTGKKVWDNVEISYGKKDGEEAIDSMAIHFEPVYVIIDKDSLISGQEMNFDNGDCWLWVYPSDGAVILEGGALDTVVYIYRRAD